MANSQQQIGYSRPSYHFLAQRGWMNDPCAPGYDPKTKTYHLFYQWNPSDCEWGNISWGHAISKDLVIWKHVSDMPVLTPDTEYDGKGVFTGCFHPAGLHGEDDELSVIYTSVCSLPIHWTIPYKRGAEGIAAATSTDGGNTWKKVLENPLLAQEPPNVHVTGWRDPYIFSWSTMDKILDTDSMLYALVSGGVHGEGPTTFLYSMSQIDLTKWSYIGPLLQMPCNYRPNLKWSGDFGRNLECTNFFTLSSEDGSITHEFLVTGSEGGQERTWVKDFYCKHPLASMRVPRYCLWMAGTLHRSATGVSMSHDFSGFLDHGIFYAANTFHDPVRNRRVVWGWLIEEDVPLDFHRRKGWCGSLGLPREVFLKTIPAVTCALKSRLSDIGSVRETHESDGTVTLHTLGIRPLPELDCQRKKELLNLHKFQLVTTFQITSDRIYEVLPVQSNNFELEASIRVTKGCKRVGISFFTTSPASALATLSLLTQEEEIVLDRSNSNQLPHINKCEERGPFTLFKQRIECGEEEFELFQLRLFVDSGVVEVFANERFSMASYVYVKSEELRLAIFAENTGRNENVDGLGVENDGVVCNFESVKIWEMGSTMA